MEKECEPYYQNELSIYEKETLQRIEEFRNARSNWSENKNINQAIYTNVNEGLHESNIYQGRCLCLRRLRLKTTFLINHFKTLKPLRYYTLKQKIAEYKKFDTEYEREDEENVIPKSIEETCSTRKLWTREALEECFQGALKVRDRRARMKKKKECKQQRPAGPCKKVIKKLKAAKFRGGLIESCKCEDGREVTVVIKGICLCDKSSLNNINLNKVCDEYSKMANRGPVPPVKNPVQAGLNQNILENNAQVKKMVEPEKGRMLKTQEDNTETEREINSVIETEPESKTQPESEVENTDEDLAGQGKKSLFGVDSIEIHKKRKRNDENRMAEDFGEDPVEMPEGTRKISFKLEDKSEKKKSEVNKGSDITLYPKITAPEFSESSNEKMQIKYVRSDSLKNLLTVSESKLKVEHREKEEVNNKSGDTKSKDQSKGKPRFVGPDESNRIGALKPNTETDNKVLKNSNLKTSKNSKTELPHWGISNGTGLFNRGKNSLEFHKKISRNDSGKTSDQKKEKLYMPDSKSKINDTSKLEKKTSLLNTSGRDNNGSMISLYRNKPEEKSYMSLTKEELEKLKRHTPLSDGKNL